MYPSPKPPHTQQGTKRAMSVPTIAQKPKKQRKPVSKAKQKEYRDRHNAKMKVKMAVEVQREVALARQINQAPIRTTRVTTSTIMDQPPNPTYTASLGYTEILGARSIDNYDISLRCQEDLGGVVYTRQLRRAPSDSTIQTMVDFAFNNFFVNESTKKHFDKVLRLRGGAGGGGGGGGGGGCNPTDYRRHSAAAGVSMMAGKNVRKLKKPNYIFAKETSNMGPKAKNKHATHTTVPFQLQCMKSRLVKNLFSERGIQYSIIKQMDSTVKHKDPLNYSWVMKTVPKQYRLYPDVVATGMSWVGDFSSGTEGVNLRHLDAGESVYGAICTFGRRVARGGSTVFWEPTKSENHDVRLAIRHRNARIIVANFDTIYHAGTPWCGRRTVKTTYIPNSIVNFFEIWKVTNKTANLSLDKHMYQARTVKEYNILMQEKDVHFNK